MNTHLIEEASFQLCQESEYQAQYLDMLRDCTLDLTPEVRLLLSLSIEKMSKIDMLLHEGLNHAPPLKKKFWQFWKK